MVYPPSWGFGSDVIWAVNPAGARENLPKAWRRRRSIVMGEHDIQVPAGGDETHLMVIVQPCARSQESRQQSRVARCKSEQQD